MKKVKIGRKAFRTENGLAFWKRVNAGGLSHNQGVSETIHVIIPKDGHYETAEGWYGIYRAHPSLRTEGAYRGRKANYYGKVLTPKEVADGGFKKHLCRFCLRKIDKAAKAGKLPLGYVEDLRKMARHSVTPAPAMAARQPLTKAGLRKVRIHNLAKARRILEAKRAGKKPVVYQRKTRSKAELDQLRLKLLVKARQIRAAKRKPAAAKRKPMTKAQLRKMRPVWLKKARDARWKKFRISRHQAQRVNRVGQNIQSKMALANLLDKTFSQVVQIFEDARKAIRA